MNPNHEVKAVAKHLSTPSSKEGAQMPGPPQWSDDDEAAFAAACDAGLDEAERLAYNAGF